MKQKNKKQKYYNPLFYRRLRFIEGIKAVIHTTSAKIAVAIYISLVLCITLLLQHYINLINTPLLIRVLHILSIVIIPSISLCGLIALITLIGTPYNCYEINEGLRQAELVNHAGEAPLLVRKTKDKTNNSITFEFYNKNISKDKIKKFQFDIEPVLNMNVIEIEYRKNNNKFVRIVTVPLNSLPDTIYWKNDYLDNRDFNIVLGKGQLGLVNVDLAENPHWLIGGATGSGKSLLLKIILKQCLAKGADVFIADFKGGVDFSEWYKTCEIITDENTLLNKLKEMTSEIKRRQKLFYEIGAQKLSEYNAQGHTLKRWIFACDEVAEILDETGLSKEEKKLISEIKHYLNTIFRLGRAFGIHAILASQRIDATMMSGQSRNNITYRVCGRADENLSDVILGNKLASEIIPINEQGLFVDNHHNTFRGFLPSETEE